MQEDNTPRWSTPTWLVGCGWILSIAAALWWSTASSAVDGLFIGVLVVVLAAVSALGSVLRPRLRADTSGVTLRTLGGTKRWSWDRVQVRVQRSQRLGRTVETLELEVPEHDVSGGLVVLTKLDLGTDVTEVAERLDRLRP